MKKRYDYRGYFTEKFQVIENKTKMRNIHARFFHLLVFKSHGWFRVRFGVT